MAENVNLSICEIDGEITDISQLDTQKYDFFYYLAKKGYSMSFHPCNIDENSSSSKTMCYIEISPDKYDEEEFNYIGEKNISITKELKPINKDEVFQHAFDAFMYILGEKKNYAYDVSRADEVSEMYWRREMASMKDDLDSIMNALSLAGTLDLRRLLKGSGGFCQTELEKEYIIQVIKYINSCIANGFFKPRENREYLTK